jgi:molybdopterin-dependent oxidoreductase alpha subunit
MPIRRWVSLSPQGLGHQKPFHYGEMLRVAWDNRDQLPFAWRILRDGVCDGCALGTSGLHDWTIPGTHLCMVRLELLRLNTAPALDRRLLADAAALATHTSAQLRELGRLPEPCVRHRGDRGFRVVTWDEAMGIIADRLRETDPHRVACYLTSRGITNEVYYVAQKAARVIGTNHVDNSARLCHAASTSAMKETLGYGASTCSYIDWLEADLIVFFGSNTPNNQPVTTKYLYKAVEHGAQVAVVNTFREPGLARYWVPSIAESAMFGTRFADHWFDVHTGGDLAFLIGVFKALLEMHASGARGGAAMNSAAAGDPAAASAVPGASGAVDAAADVSGETAASGGSAGAGTGAFAIDDAYVRDRTSGFDAARAVASDAAWTALAAESGASADDMRRFARLLVDRPKAILVWSMGLTQHVHGVQTVQALINVALARGLAGKPFCGLMPIRGHSGVQGGAEVGCVPNVDDKTRAHWASVWGFDPPDWHGLTSAEMVEASARGEIDLWWIVGGNFLETVAGTARNREALGRPGLRIHQDIVLSSSMLVDPSDTVVLLPAATRYESPGGGTETSTERRIIFSPEIPGRRVGSARPEWEVFRDVVQRAWPDRAGRMDLPDAAAVRAEIARAVPLYAGIERLAAKGDQVQWGGRTLFADGRFATSDGRAHFSAVHPRGRVRAPDRFFVSTRRGKQFNSMVQRETDPLTGAARDAVLMSDADAQRLGLRDGDAVRLVSAHGEMSGRVHVAAMHPGNLEVHWPEGVPLLSGTLLDPASLEPDYNAEVEIVVPSR